PERTVQEWFADIAARYHLGLAGALLLLAAAFVAVGRRRFLLLGLPAAVLCAAGLGVYLLGQEPLPLGRDPRMAAAAIPKGVENQVLALAGIGLLAVLCVWVLLRLLRRSRPVRGA